MFLTSVFSDQCRPVARGVQQGAISECNHHEFATYKHAYEPAKKRAAPHRIHVLPLLKRCGCEQYIFKNLFMGNMFCVMRN